MQTRLLQSYNVQHFEPKIAVVITWVDLACCAVGNQGGQVSIRSYNDTYILYVYMHTHTRIIIQAYYDICPLHSLHGTVLLHVYG